MHSYAATLRKACIWREASRIIREEGIRAFWKGKLVMIDHRLPYSSVSFYSYERYKNNRAIEGNSHSRIFFYCGRHCPGQSRACAVILFIVYRRMIVPIQKWLKEGNRTCPQTQQVLSHMDLTPNHLVCELIAQWCKDHGTELPPVQDINDGLVTDTDRNHLAFCQAM